MNPGPSAGGMTDGTSTGLVSSKALAQELERKRRHGAKAGGSKPAARRKKDKNGVLPGTHRSIESFFSGPR